MTMTKKSKKCAPVCAAPNLARRTLLASVPMLGLAPLLKAQEGSAAIHVQKLHNFTVRVSDPYRTVAFYQDLFGMPVQARFGERHVLKIGNTNQHMVVRRNEPGETSAITHIGYTVDHFDVSTQQAALVGQGFKVIDAPDPSLPGMDNAMSTWVSMRGDTPELFFADQRGLIVQLSDTSNCGGTGPMGANCPAPEGAPEGMFKLTELNHFTAFVNDGAGANTFYQEIFGLDVQAYQGAGSPVTGIGDGKQFVMYAGPFPGAENAPANLHHGCFNMEDFNVEQILAKLTDYGLTARPEGATAGPMQHYVSLRQPARGGAEGGTPEVYFTDPDGILMQLQDFTYCGGGGYLGNECLQG